MKRSFALALLGCLSLSSQAQQTPAAKPDLEIQSPLPPKTSSTTNAVLAPKDPPVKYSGLATDLKRSTNRWKMFSLRKPADPKNDGANLIRETRTEGARPIKLFSIDF